jgi:hypothetical protein
MICSVSSCYHSVQHMSNADGFTMLYNNNFNQILYHDRASEQIVQFSTLAGLTG